MANSSISISSIVITSVISFSVAVSSVSYATSYNDAVVGYDDHSISASFFIVPTSILSEQQVTTTDATITKVFDVGKVDAVLPSESLNFNVAVTKTDSVTVQETRVKVFTDFIDFDPSDADVDATPITIAESAAFDLSKSFTGADNATPSESIANNPAKPGVTASVSTSEAINQLRPHKNVTDTATTSEEINRFDVTTVLTDTVSVTEATAKNLTATDPNDSVAAVQSNVKAFTSNIDFDLSDADVDPDPVTASEQINTLGVTKGLTDTASATEATAKTIGNNSLADTASPTESTAKNFTHGGLTDSLTAVEGIKLEPSIALSDTASPAESAVFNIQQAFSNTASVTESINTNLVLGETEHFYPNQVYMHDTDPNDSSIRGYHRGLNEGGGTVFTQDVYRYRLTDFTGILGQDDSLLNNTVIWDSAVDGKGRDEFVGILGSAGLINQPRINGQSITYAETSSAGLLVNFIYTDTDDTELGGHFLNETPLCAGSYV